ncbi:MAG: hypothetical protein LBQ16_03465 [Gracilibacteraceae bacterium]|jgi:streptogramin lyase|nr:hypothetical protein [Gracilibacteraceae bacterium]
MRKHQQRQILELIETMKEAQAMGLYADCQDGALKIAEFMECLADGAGACTAALITEYYELLYRVSVGEAGADELSQALPLLENSVRAELRPDRIEAVFLSYKAGMSDSIESVYAAAKADPGCDAYWMPIPYYERQADGSLGPMRCEGADCYGGHIDCTDWRAYDIAARHPDMIFTFAPYDAGNYVTTVHPAFYCERLRGLTDLLVYVPYFVAAGDVPERFADLAGCVHAHVTAVQSEQARETYIRAFREAYGDRFGAPEDKFVALGSPKYDAVLGLRPEDFPLPQSWRRLIENPDGPRKKIVFYNTTVSALLGGDEKALAKLRHVLACFRECSDTVLWWRPHPLSEAACASMRPRLLAEYEKIIADYRHEGWGIYDDAPDWRGAAAWSDAYYGDDSSLVALYGTTGKPVMIQNLDMAGENEARGSLDFENMHDDGKYFWFTAIHFNGLFRMDKETWKTEYMGSFPGEDPAGVRLYGGMAEHEGKLYFAPMAAREIGIYDMEGGTFWKIQIPEMKAKQEWGDSLKFCSVVRHNSCLFFVGCAWPAFLRYDTVSGKTDIFADWANQLAALETAPNHAYFGTAPIVTGARFILAAENANAVVVFDMETCVSTVHEAGGKKHYFAGICGDGRDYWLAAKDGGSVIKWDAGTKQYTEYRDFPPGFAGGDHGLWKMVRMGGHVWLFALQANMTLKLRLRDGKILPAKEFPGGDYWMAVTSGSAIYAFNGKSRRLTMLDTVTGRRREEAVLVPDGIRERVDEIRAQVLEKDLGPCENAPECCHWENPLLDLRALLRHLAESSDSEKAAARRARQSELFRRTNARPDGGSGEAIYEYAKRQILGEEANGK